MPFALHMLMLCDQEPHGHGGAVDNSSSPRCSKDAVEAFHRKDLDLSAQRARRAACPA